MSAEKEIPMTDQAYGWRQDMQIPLQEKLKADLKNAMRNRDEGVRNAIRQVISEFPKLTVPITLESGKKSSRLKKSDEITNDDIIGIIGGLLKSEKTVLEAKNEPTSEYLQTLEAYMPKMVSEDEIVEWIKANIDFAQFKNKMQAMGIIMKQFGKTADGKMVNDILKNQK